MALKIQHIRFLNLVCFTHISGTIDTDEDISALINEESTNKEERENIKLRKNINDKP